MEVIKAVLVSLVRSEVRVTKGYIHKQMRYSVPKLLFLDSAYSENLHHSYYHTHQVEDEGIVTNNRVWFRYDGEDDLQEAIYSGVEKLYLNKLVMMESLKQKEKDLQKVINNLKKERKKNADR